MIKTLRPIDIQPLLDCYHGLDQHIIWTDYGHKGRQASLQHILGEDPWISGVGRAQANEDITAYDVINAAIQGTVFEDVIREFDLYRTRFMWVGPYACYSMHQDSSPRIHIPLITNGACYFLFRDEPPVHLKPGHVYYTDTRRFHTFINCSERPRLHLVGAIRDPR